MGISNDIVAILDYLLPGFVAAWIFYGLTGHPKQSPFERTVQALIFTIIIRSFVTLFERCATWIYDRTGVYIGTWDESSPLICSIAIAVIIGHLISWIANNNTYHRRLYKWRITTKTSLVSEWHSAFSSRDCYIILHLDDTMDHRKLFGWPLEWPDKPQEGHFVITEPEWLTIVDGSYERSLVEHDEMILICASKIQMVEFVKPPEANFSNVKAERGITKYFSRKWLQARTFFERLGSWRQHGTTKRNEANTTPNPTTRGKK